jgi:ABC-2 type transport system ATP-binding protein
VRVRVTPAPGVLPDLAALRSLPGAIGVEERGGVFMADLGSAEDVPAFVRAAVALPVDLLGVAEEPPTLQEAYLALVGAHADDVGEVAR